ncbi:MAG: hypothetical protein U1E65_35670 [Myxococcota bacterium]
MAYAVRTALLCSFVFATSACVAEHSVGVDDAGSDSDGNNNNNNDGGNQGGQDGSISGSGPYCDVARIFQASCNACHIPGGNYPDLTFTGGMSGLVNGTSHMFGNKVLVAPNDAAGSLLYRKVAGTQAADEGQRMPNTGVVLSAADIAAIESWINAGAPTTCNQAQPDGGTGPYHPAGFSDPMTHGLELKTQAQDCRACHGNDLSGGTGPSCDSCHQQGWRTNCTYCHGGTDSQSGAPPRDLRGETQRDMLTFRAHTEHTTVKNHAAWDCNQCHTKPSDVLSTNHIFDDSHGVADVDFSGGLSSAGQYNGNGSCASLYCHGNGRGNNGSYDHTMGEPNCSGCHPGPGSSITAYLRMSGQHARHMNEGYTCTDCHGDTVDSAGTITNPDLHVNGSKEVVFNVANFTFSGTTCTGNCHGEIHRSRRW